MNVFTKPTNLNHKGKKTCDCVVRAIAYVLREDWKTIMAELTAHAIATGYFPSDPKCYDSYLKTKGWVKIVCPMTVDGKRYSVKDIKLPRPISILKVSGHLTVVDSGYIKDTWDCSRKKVYAVYQ